MSDLSSAVAVLCVERETENDSEEGNGCCQINLLGLVGEKRGFVLECVFARMRCHKRTNNKVPQQLRRDWPHAISPLPDIVWVRNQTCKPRQPPQFHPRDIRPTERPMDLL